MFFIFSFSLCLQFCLLQMRHGYVLVQGSISCKDLATVFALGLLVDALVSIVDGLDVLHSVRLPAEHGVTARAAAGNRFVSFHPLILWAAVHCLHICVLSQ